MKKRIVAACIAVMAVLAMCVMIAACSTSIAGTYKFQSVSSNGGMEVEPELGKDFYGTVITEDYIVLELKEDETCTYSMQGQTAMSGTWTADGNKVTITISGQTLEATVDGNILTIVVNGVETHLKKA